jgi:pentatricopeptide repeat protein
MNTASPSLSNSETGISAPAPSANDAGQNRLLYFCLLGGLLVFCFLCAFFYVSDVDVGYHIRTGAYILEHHRIPTTNTFSYTTPEQEWPIHQWWPTILYNRAYHLGGVAGLISFKACIATLLMLAVWASARQILGGHSLWPFWLATAGVMIARVRFFERPDLISALMFALVVFLDLRFNNRWRWQWIGLPLLMAIWANTHGGVMYGFVFLCAVTAGDWIEAIWQRRTVAGPGTQPGIIWKPLFVRPLAIVIALIASILTLEIITPSGYRVLLLPINQFMSPFWQLVIDEYHPPVWAGYQIFYFSLCALAVLQAITWRRVRLRWLFAGFAFGYLGCSSQRSMLVYSIIAVLYAAFLVRQLPEEWRIARVKRLEPLLLPIAWAATFLIVVLPHQVLRFGIGFCAAHYPMEIYRFIDQEVAPQNVFNDMKYGGGMLWWLYPRFRPYIDGRGDAYTPEFWKTDYLPVVQARPEWRNILRRHDVHAVWVPIAHTRKVSRLAKSLFDDSGWALVAFNDDSLLFLERTQLNCATISSNEFRIIWPGDWTFSKVNPETIKAATAEAHRALIRSPDSVFARTAAARTSMLSGDYTKAAALYGALVESLGESEPYSRDYGYCLFMLGQLEEADRIFKQMIDRGWLPAFASYMRYRIAVERKNWAAADRYLARALELEPANEKYRDAQARLQDTVKSTVLR